MSFCGAQVTTRQTCGDDAIVRWGDGDQIVDLCLRHFEDALAETRRLLDQAQDLAAQVDARIGGGR